MTDVQNEDSDSDWDSTLDFTSPRQTAGQKIPNIQLETEDDFSQQESIFTNKPVPAERTNISSNVSPPPVAVRDDPNSDNENVSVKANIKASTPRTSTSIMKTPSQRSSASRVEESPPFNFRPAVTGTMTPGREEVRPGKDRKGTTYDVDRSQPVQRTDSVNSWDDSDADEKTLQELRQTFSKEKQKELEAEAQKQKQLNAEVVEDGQMTNRSETTWKSWASFGPKKTKKNNNKKEGIPVATKTDIQASHASKVLKLQDISYVENKSRDDVIIGEKESVTNLSEQPAMASQPYIVKDEEGTITYYFGHGPLQYLETEDEADEAFMPRIAERLERLFERIWREVFGALRILTSFFIILVVELLKYFIKYIFQPIVIGVFQTLGDFIMKPLLSVLFNGFLQPCSIFLWNSFVTLKHMFSPIAEILRKVLREFALCCRSVRLVEINWKVGDPGPRAEPIEYGSNRLQHV